jgi:hypothetical protein
MAEKRETLVTFGVSKAEATVIRNNARAKGLSVAAWLRLLLRRENVDLKR